MFKFHTNHVVFVYMGTNKWMIIPDMGYVIANQYNVIVVCLSQMKSTTIFSLMNKPRLNLGTIELLQLDTLMVFSSVDSGEELCF